MRFDKIFFMSLMKNKFNMNSPVLSELAEQGSDRQYFRISNDEKSFVLMLYGDEKRENTYFFHIQQFLSRIKVNVPYIHYYDPDKKLILMEDLGDKNLYSLIKKGSYKLSKTFYEKIIDQAVNIYTLGVEQYKKETFVTEQPFDYDLHKWEYTYFLDNYVKAYRKISYPLDNLVNELDNLAKTLSIMEKSIIHRDFQSKNIIIKDNQPYFIDFQGLRPGLPEYDMASLLFDPYVDLDENFINDMFAYYCRKMRTGEPSVHLETRFLLCAIQRLMQALGAFCFLGLVKGKTDFLSYISPAEKKMNGIFGKISYFKQLPGLFS